MLGLVGTPNVCCFFRAKAQLCENASVLYAAGLSWLEAWRGQLNYLYGENFAIYNLFIILNKES